MKLSRRLARIAGVLYLLNGVFAGFAFAYVLGKVYVAGDATTTSANVVANAGLVRIGVVADLLQATIWVCYLVGLLAVLLFPDSGERVNVLVTIPSAVAEIATVLYLLIVGVKTVEPRK